MLHPVPVLTEVFDAIESKETWIPETPPSFLSYLGLSSLAHIVPCVPIMPLEPTTPLVSGALPAGAVFLNTNFSFVFQVCKD